jgi:histidinol-phosphate/aromatic aminotransferase/cobyric acid decarboxylase-like protein
MMKGSVTISIEDFDRLRALEKKQGDHTLVVAGAQEIIQALMRTMPMTDAKAFADHYNQDSERNTALRLKEQGWTLERKQ